MEVFEGSLSGIPLLRIVGDVDHSGSSIFDDAVQRALALEKGRLFLDLSDCLYIDSGGLGAILYALKGRQDRLWLGVIGPDANILRLFTLVGLADDPSLQIFSSVDEARAYLGETGT